MKTEDEIEQKYKELFFYTDDNGNPRYSAYYYGMGMGDGWLGLIDSICFAISEYQKNRSRELLIENATDRLSSYYKYPRRRIYKELQKYISKRVAIYSRHGEEVVYRDVLIDQIKEKFGGLRMYTDYGDRVTQALVDFGEEFSFRICEVCGKRGKLRRDGYWLVTLCNKHWAERTARRGKFKNNN